MTSQRGNSLLRRLDKYIGIPAVLFLRVIAKMKSAKVIKNPTKIGLFVFGALGDTLIASPIFFDLQEKYPDTKMYIFITPTNQPMKELINTQKNSFEFITLSLSHLFNDLSIIRRLNLDLVIDFNQWIRLSALMAFFSKAKFTLGFKTKKQYRHFLFDEIVEHLDSIIPLARKMGGGSERKTGVCQPVHEDLSAEPTNPFSTRVEFGKRYIHEIENYRRLIKPLNIDSNRLPKIILPKESRKENMIVFHPFGSGYCHDLKEWSTEHWIELAHHLIEENFIVIITGSIKDQEAAEAIIKKAKFPSDRFISMAGKLSLKDTAILLQKSRALITVNTGIMHIGAALDIPIIALHGAVNPKRWGPLNKNSISLTPKQMTQKPLYLGFEYPHNAKNLLEQITVEEVIEALIQPKKSRWHRSERKQCDED